MMDGHVSQQEMIDELRSRGFLVVAPGPAKDFWTAITRARVNLNRAEWCLDNSGYPPEEVQDSDSSPR